MRHVIASVKQNLWEEYACHLMLSTSFSFKFLYPKSRNNLEYGLGEQGMLSFVTAIWHKLNLSVLFLFSFLHVFFRSWDQSPQIWRQIFCTRCRGVLWVFLKGEMVALRTQSWFSFVTLGLSKGYDLIYGVWKLWYKCFSVLVRKKTAGCRRLISYRKMSQF